jgi:hypothetical protein
MAWIVRHRQWTRPRVWVRRSAHRCPDCVRSASCHCLSSSGCPCQSGNPFQRVRTGEPDRRDNLRCRRRAPSALGRPPDLSADADHFYEAVQLDVDAVLVMIYPAAP